MSTVCSERRETCTVTMELNTYNAMTLRAKSGQTYQVVDTETPSITARLDSLDVGNEVTVTVTRTPSRGDGWCVTGVCLE